MKKVAYSLKTVLKRFKNKNLRLLWLTHVFSQLANYLLLFVLLGRVFELTGSTMALGLLWTIYALPILFLGPFSGSIVDCLSKRRILIITNLLQVLVITGYGLVFFTQNSFLVYALIFLYSIINQLNNPAEQASIPAFLPKKDFLLINNLFFFSDQGAFILGSILSGLLVRFSSPLTVVLFTAVLTLLSAFFAAFLPSDAPANKFPEWNKAIESFLIKIKEGYSFIAGQTLMVYSFGLVLLFQVVVVIFALILPGFSSQILGLSPYDASWLVVFPLLCGAAAGTFLLTQNQDRVRKKEWIGAGLFTLGIILLVFALVVPRLKFGRELVSLPLSFLAGLSAAFAYAPGRAFIQETAPGKKRGRIFGTLSFFMALVTIPPGIFAALITELITVKGFLTIIGLIVLAIGYFVLKKGGDVILAANHRS
ncbi:MFS transporter [Candidatus Shapirobacteria bacterium]|nr:MFS transporter [Candidatus Shapirobacteria bacterium]